MVSGEGKVFSLGCGKVGRGRFPITDMGEAHGWQDANLLWKTNGPLKENGGDIFCAVRAVGLNSAM